MGVSFCSTYQVIRIKPACLFLTLVSGFCSTYQVNRITTSMSLLNPFAAKHFVVVVVVVVAAAAAVVVACLLACFYIALFSALEQTHCARISFYMSD